MRVLGLVLGLIVALTLTAPAQARAELTISDLDVFLNDQEVTVHVVVLGAIPPTFYESLAIGIPARLRFTVELWQYNPYWHDTRLITRQVDRTLEYNVVTKEYKVMSTRGESGVVYTTRDLRDAQRVLSEIPSLKLAAASALEPVEIFYVRVRAETALRGENTFITRMAGTAEQTSRQSDYRTIMRTQ